MNKSKSLFWPSYVDLMTSLFAVVLVLFIVSFAVDKKVKMEQKRIIEGLSQASSALDGKFFKINKELKRYELRTNVTFETGSAVIPSDKVEYILDAGRSLKQTLDTLSKVKYKTYDIMYFVTIEGMASNDGYYANDELSYARAQAVKSLWEANSILSKDTRVEVMVAGSGVRGLGRSSNEVENQRILIQIIPKIIDANNSLK